MLYLRQDRPKLKVFTTARALDLRRNGRALALCRGRLALSSLRRDGPELDLRPASVLRLKALHGALLRLARGGEQPPRPPLAREVGERPGGSKM